MSRPKQRFEFIEFKTTADGFLGLPIGHNREATVIILATVASGPIHLKALVEMDLKGSFQIFWESDKSWDAGWDPKVGARPEWIRITRAYKEKLAKGRFVWRDSYGMLNPTCHRPQGCVYDPKALELMNKVDRWFRGQPKVRLGISLGLAQLLKTKEGDLARLTALYQETLDQAAQVALLTHPEKDMRSWGIALLAKLRQVDRA